MKSLIFILIIAFNTFVFTQINSSQSYKIADSIIAFSLTKNDGYNFLRDFCKIGHRLNGSKNLEKAIEWSKKKMIELKFDTTWLQAATIPHWERGNIEVCKIAKSKYFKNRKLNISALGGSVGTENKNLVGQVIEVKSFTELKEISEQVKGKIVFFNRPLDRAKVYTFEGYGGAVDQRTMGAIMAANYGGIAAIVRSVTTKNDNVTHVGIMSYVDSLTKIPAVAIGSLDADFLSEALKKENNLEVMLKLSCQNFDPVISYNVIGEIRGTEKPNEVIVVGGHIDSWDQGDGAHDDAAGCIQAMEVLHIFKSLNIKPKRTIRCIFFANEETGGSGGVSYAKYIDSIKEKHIAAIESDRGAYTPRGFTVNTDSITLEYFQKWIPILNKTGIEWIKKGGSGVDVAKIKNAKALFGYAPDWQRYMDVHHSANDIFSEVHPREFELGTASMAVLVYLLSDEF